MIEAIFSAFPLLNDVYTLFIFYLLLPPDCCYSMCNTPSLQKLLFLDTAEGVAGTIRPYWAEATVDRASVVQAQPDMLEIVPLGTSKGSGVKILLDHLGATPDEVCRSS